MYLHFFVINGVWLKCDRATGDPSDVSGGILELRVQASASGLICASRIRWIHAECGGALAFSKSTTTEVSPSYLAQLKLCKRLRRFSALLTP